MKNILKHIVVWILTLEAKTVIKKYKPKIIGVTGSVGKTSTKDAIFTVLGDHFYVRKSRKSFNSEIGIPLTILGCDTAWSNPLLWLKNILIGFGVIFFPNHYPEWLVLEVGLDRPGDIKNVIRWLSFDVVVYTRLSERPVHVEFFDSPKALLEEKAALLKGLKRGGVFVVNADDPLQTEYQRESATRLTYGLKEASVMGSHIAIEYKDDEPVGMSFRVDHAGSSVPVVIHGVLGSQHVYPALAAFAVGLLLDINLVHMQKSYSKHKHMPGRMRILKGIHSSILIDDSYNASPIATETALDTFAQLTVSGKKICILGDMTELGELTVESHESIGKKAAACTDLFIAVGHRMSVAAETAHSAGMSSTAVITYDTAREAAVHAKELLAAGDIVLIKGSQSMRMERVTKALLEKPEEGKKLLVRQENIWLKQ